MDELPSNDIETPLILPDISPTREDLDNTERDDSMDSDNIESNDETDSGNDEVSEEESNDDDSEENGKEESGDTSSLIPFP